MQILPSVLGQWDDLMVKDPSASKIVNIADLSIVSKFNMGPFERSEDAFYLPNQHVLISNANSKRIRNSELKGKSSENADQKRIKPGNREVSQIKKQTSNKLGKERSMEEESRLARGQVNSFEIKTKAQEKPGSKILFDFLTKLKSIKNQINQLNILLAAAENFNKKFDGLENESSDDYSEKDLRILDNSKTDSGNGSNEKIEYEKPGGEKNRILSKNRFKSMNNLTHGNQYQIGNIFIFNRLSEKKENAVSNFNEYEKGDGEVFSQLTTGKTGDFLGETLNNLKYSAVSKATEDDRSGVTNLPSVESEIDLTKDFRCNFSKAYLHRNLTSERISQMSKIIDFVERYHGIMSNLKSSVDLSPRGDAENVSHVSLIKNQIENAKTKKSERKGTHGRRKVELTWATPRILSEGPKVVAEDSYHSKTETFRRKGSFT